MQHSAPLKVADGGQSQSPVTVASDVRINTRPILLVGAVITLITFVGFGSWAATAPLASAVVSEGVIKIASDRKTIAHPDGGVVRDILVRNGDTVHKGTPLIRLDDVKARTTVDELRNSYNGARARQARLMAERSGSRTITFPPDVAVRRINQDPAIEQLLDREEEVFSARRARFDGEVTILREKSAQLQKQIEGEEAQLAATEKQMALALQELDMLQTLLKKRLVEKSRVLRMESRVAELEGQAGEHIAESARLATQVSEIRLQVMQKHHSFREEVVTKLREVDEEISDFESRITDAVHTADNTVIVAPESGVVMGLSVHSTGEVVKPAEPILELIPVGGAFVVEARVRPSDVEDLRAGQPAQVRMTAFRQRVTPSLEGRLVYVSADRFTDEKTQQGYYIARVEILPEALKKLGDQTILPGMPAEIMIESGKRTALAYISQPILDGLSRSWREK